MNRAKKERKELPHVSRTKLIAVRVRPEQKRFGAAETSRQAQLYGRALVALMPRVFFCGGASHLRNQRRRASHCCPKSRVCVCVCILSPPNSGPSNSLAQRESNVPSPSRRFLKHDDHGMQLLVPEHLLNPECEGCRPPPRPPGRVPDKRLHKQECSPLRRE